jgi:hypothetical protein
LAQRSNKTAPKPNPDPNYASKTLQNVSKSLQNVSKSLQNVSQCLEIASKCLEIVSKCLEIATPRYSYPRTRAQEVGWHAGGTKSIEAFGVNQHIKKRAVWD